MVTAKKRSVLAKGLLIAVAAVLVLSGCMRGQMKLTVNDDDTVSGSVVLAIAENMLEVKDGETLSEAVDRFFDQRKDDPTKDVPGAQVNDYQSDGYVGRQADFTNVSFTDFTQHFSNYGLILTHDDGYQFEMTIDLRNHSELNDDVRKDMEVLVSVTLPGDIIETNGIADGQNVSWTVNAMEKTTLTASSTEVPSAPESSSSISLDGAENSSPLTWLVWLIVAVLVALLAIMGSIWWDRRRKTQSRQVMAPPPSPMDDTQEIPVIAPSQQEQHPPHH